MTRASARLIALALMGCGPVSTDGDPSEQFEWSAPVTAAAVVPVIRRVEGASFPAPSTDCAASVSFARNEGSGAEAGFLATELGRLFYTYHPHSGADPDAPLLVLFNGGPGAPTTPYLFAGGTAPRTVIWEREALAAPIENPASWTRFAHLLYVDAPRAGYSYLLEEAERPSVARDAASFLTALLVFLDCRMDRPDRAVGFVGESYGGPRSFAMMWHLHHPDGSDPDEPDAPGYEAAWSAAHQRALSERISAHFARVAAGRGEVYEHRPELVARQFFAQILIQPSVPFVIGYGDVIGRTRAGAARLAEAAPAPVPDEVIGRGRAAVIARTEAEVLFDVRLEDIPWMSRDARPLMPWMPDPDGPPGQEPPPPSPHYLDEVFGELPVGSSYFSTPGLGAQLEAPTSIYATVLAWTPTFITDAVEDRGVLSPAAGELFEEYGVVRASRLRDGWIDLALEDGTQRSIRMPRFAAGHTVPMYQPSEIASAVESWLAEVRSSEPSP